MMIKEAYIGENLIYLNGEAGATFALRIAPGIQSITYQINGEPITENVKPGEIFKGFYRGRITDLRFFLDEDNGYIVSYRNNKYTEIIEFPYVPACTSYYGMFIGSYLTDVNALQNIIHPAVKNLGEMFQNCNDLKDISALATWNMSDVESTASMFYRCFALEDISALADWDVSNITNMTSMFRECTKLKDISALRKWKVNANVGGMFSYSAIEEADIRGWILQGKISREQDGMFYGCRSLKSVNIDDTDITNILTYGFYNCDVLTDLIGTPKEIKSIEISLTNIYLNTCDLNKDSFMKIINAWDGVKSHKLIVSTKIYDYLDSTDLALATSKNLTILTE